MFGLLRRYVCSIPGLICFHLAEVLYNRMMNLLTCVGFLAALQGAACFQHWLFKKVGTKDMYSAQRFCFSFPVNTSPSKEFQRTVFHSSSKTTVYDSHLSQFISLMCYQVRTLRKGCLWWCGPPCSTWVFLSRGSTGRSFTRARGDLLNSPNMWVWGNVRNIFIQIHI